MGLIVTLKSSVGGGGGLGLRSAIHVGIPTTSVTMQVANPILFAVLIERLVMGQNLKPFLLNEAFATFLGLT